MHSPQPIHMDGAQPMRMNNPQPMRMNNPQPMRMNNPQPFRMDNPQPIRMDGAQTSPRHVETERVSTSEWAAIDTAFALLESRPTLAASGGTTKPSAGFVVNVRTGTPFDVYVGRTVGREGNILYADEGWGNPFKIDRNSQPRSVAVEKYRDWACAPEQGAWRSRVRTELRGKVLGCWCHPKTCHADVLVEIANGEGSGGHP